MEEERKHPLTMWRGGLFLLALAMMKYCVCSGLHAPELSTVTGASYQATWMLWLEGKHFWLENCFSATVLPAQQKHYSQRIFFTWRKQFIFWLQWILYTSCHSEFQNSLLYNMFLKPNPNQMIKWKLFLNRDSYMRYGINLGLTECAFS